MNFEISAAGIFLGVSGIILGTIAIILLFKVSYGKLVSMNLKEKYIGHKWKSPLEGRSKYPEADAFRLSGSFLNYGFLVALLLMIFAFGWTSYEKKLDLSQYQLTLDDEIEIETPRTAEPPPPPPPPPVITNINVLEDNSQKIEAIIFEDQSIDEFTVNKEPVVSETKTAAPPPPPPPVIKETEKEIFKVVEEHPRFPGCEDLGTKEEKQKCSEAILIEFIYSHIKYPQLARENGISGMVVVQFVVEPDGSISNINVMRDIGAGCGDEAGRIVKLMPKWIPGKQRGHPVRVQFTLPVRFKLE